ncbi:murein biosynthesis integral membrane protein MurJ, partial [Streptomyces sp. UNOB3_S3]|nr:murein biosynthesis integral membrane protein MurJ [Streptomyces sp. UNOB3_S3]
MSAPYDGDRGQGTGGEQRGQYPPPPPAPAPAAADQSHQGPYARDPYLRDAYASDPYAAPQPGGYQQPPVPPHGPDTRAWAPAQAQQPPAPARPYEEQDATQVIGVGGFDEQPQRDAFAHLYRDQQQPYEPPRPDGRPIPAPGQYGSP